MKLKIKKYLFFAFSYSLLITVFVACSEDKSKEIFGKWQISFDAKAYEQTMSNKEKAIYAKLTDKQKVTAMQEINQMAQKNIFEFKSDNSYELTLRGEKQRGNWKIANDGKILTLKPNTTETSKEEIREELLIKSISKDKIIFLAQGKEVVLISAK